MTNTPIATPTFLVGLEPRLRSLITLFLLVLSIGFFTGIRFVHFTTDATPEGISAQYLGNEEDEDAEVMKFKKSGHEMLNLTHTHLLSLSVIFFILGLLVYGSPMPEGLKTFLLVEPLLSVLVTFGSIYLLWTGMDWIKYLIVLSRTLMTVSYILSVGFILKAMYVSIA